MMTAKTTAGDSGRGVLVVFAKAPRPGLVKTRLSPPLSLPQAAVLYTAMLRDVAAASAAFGTEFGLDLALGYAPDDGAEELNSFFPPGFTRFPQRGEGLALRMANAFADCAAAGAPWTLLRGSDSPGLDRRCVEQAIEGLENGADLTLTRDQGGGYAMIGMRIPRPELFDLPMSTDQVFESTLARARQLNLEVTVTAPSFDLDTASDLRDFLAKTDKTDKAVSGLSHHTQMQIGLLQADGVL